MVYKPQGVCSTQIDIELEDKDGEKFVKSVKYTDGCNGNTKGISALVEGMKATDVIGKLDGMKCGRRKTSCPDQLAQALKAMV